MKRIISKQKLQEFRQYLYNEERSIATVSKYMRDLTRFFEYAQEKELTKTVALEYKNSLLKDYAATSANSMLAALNAFLKFCGWHDLCVKQYKIQKSAFNSEEKELTKAEYVRLIQTAKTKGNERLSLIIQTICGTGIRVSELQHITVESAQRGEAVVCCKGKNRRIFIVADLRKKLLQYAKRQKILSGAIFITKNGAHVSRHNIWRDMKKLCKEAHVLESKVFPHNLRHLFARTFYGIEKDIAKLADILGHSSINTTRVYIISTASEHKRKLENMRLIV